MHATIDDEVVRDVFRCVDGNSEADPAVVPLGV